MIRSFRNKTTEAAFEGIAIKGFPAGLLAVARRKLRMVHRSVDLTDPRVPSGNRLEALRGDRLGQHSIRVNDQFRVCFVWRNGDAYDVEIVDYH